MKTYSSSVCCSSWVCEKRKGAKRLQMWKKRIIRCDIKRCLDLMRYCLLYSPWHWVFPGIGCFQMCSKQLGELLLCPSRDIFIYGKAHTPCPYHCIVLGDFWEATAGYIFCIWRSIGPIAEVCVCLFLVSSAVLLARVCLASLCVLVLLIPKELIKQGVTLGASWHSAAWRGAGCPAHLWGEDN